MKKIWLIFTLCTVSFLLTACWYGSESDTGSPVNDKREESTPKGTDAKYSDGVTSEETITDMPLRDFLMPDGAVALYEGEGHKRGELRVQVTQPYEKHFVLYEKNGESGERYVRKTYRLDDDQITKLEETIVDYEDDFPTLEEVQNMESIGIYLKKPFEKGASFEDWTIVDTEVTVETPYRTFGNAFLLEQNNDEAIIRKYFVQGFGEVKRELIGNQANGEANIVTSSLKSVNGI